MEPGLGRLKYQVLVVDILRALKERYTYTELSRRLGVDKARLAKYVSGSVAPSPLKAVELWERIRGAFKPAMLVLEAAARYGGLLDLSPVLEDPAMLKIASLDLAERFQGAGVTKILAPEAGGIPLATAMSLIFNVGLVIARRSKENPLADYIEEHIVESPRVSRIFYIPRDSIKRGDRVLIVDDIVQTGFTLAVMRKLVERSGASLAGVAALVVVGDEWRERSGVSHVEAVVRVKKPG
ncbi:phosphoribosyltransferase family protein [Stetteria hydrogenophila]